ncbi:putative Ulp1 protease family catalytic domain, papain-like cysteine peptidase superfamily [Helianthus annuus]|uniref:Ulp1 protease family catalytic domain, papain-like cysteine peptidase superfamily n=1 Tax=Helianthus annuus TaxID=4232 RepID=A0A9K3HXL9_HELAN|nr:putative Ulp1 protease family catalytic domain, papain-like cysteine peptidase superfamily [Helianthus annuus]
MIKLRRSERLVKPAKATLSPFVVYKNLRRKQKNISNNEDQLIEKIKNWAPSSGVRQLTLTAGGYAGPDFWGSLLGTEGNGWLSDEHIFAWMLHMYNSRDPSARWSILPPYFQMHLQTLDQKFACYFNGKVEPFPRITSVDEVYVPLFIPSIHWFLGVFNLVNGTLTIYDSLMGMRDLDKGRTEVVCHINFVFDHWLRLHGYYDNKPLPFKFPFQTEYANDVPQQSGPLGDCGVWVCIFLDRLINKKPLNDGEKTSITATRMRRHMLTLFYNSLIPKELVNELEEDDLEFIQ